MRIIKEEGFRPITIKLESQQDYEEFKHILRDAVEERTQGYKYRFFSHAPVVGVLKLLMETFK